MTGPLALLPSQIAGTAAGRPRTGSLGSFMPAPTVMELSEDEQRAIKGLASDLSMRAPALLQLWAYYDGQQRLSNLGISIPPKLQGVRTVVDWPRICVDPLAMRAVLAGFRLPNETEVNDELDAHWTANDMSAEFPLAVLDSLVARCGFIIVGSPDEEGDSPVVTVESPLNMAATWDPRRKMTTAAYQAYEVGGESFAALYLPDVTIQMRREQAGRWVVEDRDEHGFGEVPVVRMPNRARSSNREGQSEITSAVMNTTDSACRSLLGMEIAREVYSIPHIWVLGASESDFVSSAGTQRTAMDMAMTKILALERDEEGELPQVGQFKAFDPSVFTKIIDEHAQLMASYTGFPPSYFGQNSTANPASADAIRVSMNGIDRHGERVQAQATAPARKTAQLIWRFAHGGAPLPVEARRLEVDWADAATPTPAATTDAIAKQVSVGAIPATSDVTLQALGYTPLQRKRLEQDRKNDLSGQLEAELTTSLAARQSRTGSSVANSLDKARAAGPETPPGQSGR